MAGPASLRPWLDVQRNTQRPSPGVLPRELATVLFGALAFGVVAHAFSVHAVFPAVPISPQQVASHLIFVTDDIARPGYAGCDAVSVIDADTMNALTRGEYRMSPGQLTSTSKGDLVVSMSANGGNFVHVLRRHLPSSTWHTSIIDDDRPTRQGQQWLVRGPPAISPDDRILLMPLEAGVEKYAVSGITDRSLGPVLGTFHGPAGLLPSDIVFAPDSGTAYIIGGDGFVYYLNVESMQPVGSPIPYPPTVVQRSWRVLRTYADLSPDGDFLVINTGRQQAGNITVVNVATREVRLVAAPGMIETWGVSFNHAAENHGLLAIHGMDRVSIFHFNEFSSLGGVASIPVPRRALQNPDYLSAPETVRPASLAWGYDGRTIVVSKGGPATGTEWRVLYLVGSPPNGFRVVTDFDSCELTQDPARFPREVEPLDILTLNGRIGLATPTPTPTPTLTSPPSPSLTPSPPNTQTATPSPTPSPTPIAIPTPVPSPIYVPLLLRENCIPGTQRADVVLVLDASTSMLEPTATGRSKLDAAVAAARIFLDQLHLDAGDQSAIVSFNGDAWLLAALTAARTSLVAALSGIRTAQYTRIDRGIAVAREELAGPRRRAGNTAVMVVLTDGRANPVPVSAAVGEAQAAKDAGVVVFTVGLGADVDIEALRVMASRPRYFHLAPDAEQLADIYRGVAVAIPCPADTFWGGR